MDHTIEDLENSLFPRNCELCKDHLIQTIKTVAGALNSWSFSDIAIWKQGTCIIPEKPKYFYGLFFLEVLGWFRSSQ